MLLDGKNAVVYGAGGAVGGAVARAFAREGARVFLAGRTEAKVARVAAEIRAGGGRAEASVVDALDRDAVEAHLETVARLAGPVRVAFNAIDWGDTQGQALTEMPLERFSHPIATAMQTWFVTGTAAARHMARNGGGTIAGITANAGRSPIAMVGGFGVACAAVEHFLRQLAVEVGPAGVRVCFVRSAGSPDATGVREAFRLRASEAGVSVDEVLRQAGAGAALRRMPMLAEVADAAALLCSDHARGMTATLANVTCGAQVD
jgi:NAD(P)-dependent dehydrogenase (short-subunit alcohol dehydrogenase family)